MAIRRLKLQLSLIFLSAALIAFQIELMQILSIIQWHHFGYMIISIALLGFGASGTCIALFQTWLLQRFNILLPRLMFCCSLSIILSLILSQNLTSSIDIFMLFIDPRQIFFFILNQFIYFLVFFSGALAIGFIFIKDSENIGDHYFANLLGSGLGGITVVIAMYTFLPQQLATITAVLPLVSGFISIRKAQVSNTIFALVSLGIIIFSYFHPLPVKPSPYKSISRTLDLPQAEIITTRPDPVGLLQIVKAPSIRFAPGLSLNYNREIPTVDGAAFLNGEGFGAIYGGNTEFMKATIDSAAFLLGRPKQILSLQPGTGADIFQALSQSPDQITAIEPNRTIIEVLNEQYGKDSPYSHPLVQSHVIHSRTWLATDKNNYDLITIPPVGSFGGSSGLFALKEQPLLTLDAFSELWAHLNKDGLIKVSAWIDTPARNPLRLAATIAEMLEKHNQDYRQHVIAIRGWDMICFLIKRSALTKEDFDRISTFCTTYQFDLLLPARLRADEPFHSSANHSFIKSIDTLFHPASRPGLYKKYHFDISPVSDDRPFFSQFLRYRSISSVIDLFGQRSLPFLEFGYFIVLVTFVELVIATAVLMILPLLRLGLPGKTSGGWPLILYFSGLGLGYMFVEIALIHELVLYLGHQVYAASASIGTLLIFSGLGSLASGKIKPSSHTRTVIMAVIVFILLVYTAFLPEILQKTIGFPLVFRLLFTLLLISLPAFLMGMPFPLGLNQVARQSKKEAAWAWGINGSFSVIATGLATIAAIEIGFPALLLIVACTYGTATLAGSKIN